MNKQTLAAFTYAISLLSAASAAAQPAIEEQRQYVVHYSDLDVTREPGARVLLSRLEGAARIVCCPADDSADLRRISLYQSCIKDALARAVTAAHVPLVSELYGQSVTAIAEN